MEIEAKKIRKDNEELEKATALETIKMQIDKRRVI